MSEFLFEKDPRYDELIMALNNSSPVYSSNLVFLKSGANLDLGEFRFLIKGFYKKEYEIIFHKTRTSINDFWRFLEVLAKGNNSLLFDMYYKGREVFIICSKFNKTDLRFSVLDTFELYKKEREGKILSYSYAECNIGLDLIINKRKFIKSFYKELYRLLKESASVVYFEPPLIDFNFWIKDSEILKSYVKKCYVKVDNP